MTRQADSLLRELRMLKRRAQPTRERRQWVIALEEDEEICDELKKHLGPRDTLYIVEIHKGLISEDMKPAHGQSMACWLSGPRGIKTPHVVYERKP